MHASKPRRTFDQLCEGALPKAEYAEKVLKAKVTSQMRETGYALPRPFHRAIPGQSEATVLAHCKEALILHNVNFDRIQVQGQIVHHGEHASLIKSPMRSMADLQMCISGRLIVAEVKKPGGKVMQHQIDWLKRKQLAGAFACIIVSAEGMHRLIRQSKLSQFDFEHAAMQGIPVLG